MRPVMSVLRGVVRGYQLFISPLLGCHCRFRPTCSQYAIEALSRFGAVKGSVLSLRRIMRCHPWGGSGYDPVPRAEQNNALHPLQGNGTNKI